MPDSTSATSSSPRWLQIPEVARVLPFAVFVLITALAPGLFAGSEYWLYAVKTAGVAALLWWLRRWLPEMKLAFSASAVAVGVAVAVLWWGLEGRIPTLTQVWQWVAHGFQAWPAATPEPPWNPFKQFPESPTLAWFFVLVRVVGRSCVVPLVEEVFYRGFVYRYFISARFTEVPLTTWNPFAFVATCLLFGLSHPGQWLAGIICAAAYQWLVIRHGRLGDAITAHAVTNLLLSGWAIGTGQWQFT
ncbi:MAG TPA: CAAX prenyl protease-related protein [Verrucomicrobiota bacterium]|nr:CAAX prenyl protease-related protein [Verrucomicrobiales bacterium]HRI11593.1 CAAX prenyl protease-related protein [Verrucomicrobiota bacterium]